MAMLKPAANLIKVGPASVGARAANELSNAI